MRKLDIQGTCRNISLHSPDIEEMAMGPAILEIVEDLSGNYDSFLINRLILEEIVRNSLFLCQNPGMIEFYE